MLLGLISTYCATILVDPLDHPDLKGSVISAMVVDSAGKVVYARGADTRVVPASNQKLFSAAFALSKLGTTFRPKTQFYADQDRLVITSTGDPGMTSEQLLAMSRTIQGVPFAKVQLRQAYRCDRPDTWQIGDAPNRYAPAIHALSFDKSGVELRTSEGELVAPGASDSITFRRVPGSVFKFDYNPFRGEVTFSGTVPSGSKLLDTLSLPDPSATAAGMFGTYDPLEAIEPLGSPMQTITGAPLSKLLQDCLRPSDNHLAEHLVLMGSKESAHVKACAEMAKWLLSGPGLDKAAFKISDGSGISRHNITTARSIVRLLMWQQKQTTAQVFRDALARPDVSGTLSGRLKGVTFMGKTGTLDMVSSLSGYVKCKDGSQKIVSVILNHYACSSNEARQHIDRFIENVCN